MNIYLLIEKMEELQQALAIEVKEKNFDYNQAIQLLEELKTIIYRLK